MKTIQYSDMLKRAFITAWGNRFLWIFGIFVFFGSSSINIVSKFGNYTHGIFNAGLFLQPGYLKTIPTTFCLLLFFAVCLYLFRILNIVSLVKSANDPSVYKKSQLLSIYSESTNYFGRLLLLEIFFDAAAGITILFLALPVNYLFSGNRDLFASLTLFVAILLFTALTCLIYITRRYAYLFVILSESRTLNAMRLGCGLFLKNIKISFEMFLINLLLILGLFFVIILTFILLSIPFGILGFLIYNFFGIVGLTLIVAIGAVALIALSLVEIAFFNVFLETVWLYFFQELTLDKLNEEETETLMITRDIMDAETA